MDIHENHLLATCKTTTAFGVKYTADFPAPTVGGQQFAIVSAAVPQQGDLGAQQVSGDHQKKAGVKSKAVAYLQLHDDLLHISGAAHSLVLLGTPGLDGKFHLPRNHGAQAMLNTARAFQKDAPAFSAAMIGLGMDADFLAHLDTHITDFETAIAAKGTGQLAEGKATGGMEDAAHKAAIALRVLDTIVPLKYANDPAKLAEWTIASHVERHTPVPRAKPAPPAPAKVPAP